ncbi:peptidase C12, ubiquitin carboxyl-terminal hydrolase [Dichotomocladium elegans]|nr:peptidase C12, ubiquitin carboxyl-terminal hydrolase [Dichotomocladium elegans]
MTIKNPLQPLRCPREEDQPWCLLESEPDIFTEMLQCYGAKDLKVEELYDLDIMPSDTIYGLIFAKPCDDETLPPPIQSKEDEEDAEAVFFSCQIVTNICATLALLGILFNIDHLVCIGEHLKSLKDILRYASPMLRGNAIGNDSLLREIHNSFADAQARASAEEPPAKIRKGKKGKKKMVVEDTKMYHYVSFIPLNGYIWELDGFNKYPVKIAKITQEDWTETIKPILRERMAALGQSQFC